MESTPSAQLSAPPASTSTPEAEAYRFETKRSGNERKKGGVFYTPAGLADEILREVLAGPLAAGSRDTILGWRILDPACGTGLFLIRALRLLVSLLSSRGLPEAEAAEHLVTRGLFGVDRDVQAVECAKRLLARTAAEYGCSIEPEHIRSIRCGDSLLAEDLFPPLRLPAELSPFLWLSEFPHIATEGGFDFVVGNPPYGLSRDEQLSPVENQVLQKLYAPFRTGKINKYLAFIALGYRLLKSGGRLSYVVPNSWLGIRSGTALRSLLLSEHALERLTIFEYPVFTDPSVECVTFIARKNRQERSFEIIRRRGKHELPLASSVTHQAFLAEPQSRISTLWSAEDSEVIGRMRAQSVPLASEETPFLPLIALQAYATGKGTPPQSPAQVKGRVFHCETREDANCHPYLEGADIRRFSISWSGRYLRHGEWLAEPQTLARFSGPRVVLREILNPAPDLIAAAYVDSTYLYNKSALHIIAKGSASAEVMQALCALLNSRVMSYYVKLCGCKSQRKLFPKIVNDDLRELPLPKRFEERARDLALLCKHMSRGNSPELEEKLDDLAAELYGLSGEQRARIRNFLATN